MYEHKHAAQRTTALQRDDSSAVYFIFYSHVCVCTNKKKIIVLNIKCITFWKTQLLLSIPNGNCLDYDIDRAKTKLENSYKYIPYGLYSYLKSMLLIFTIKKSVMRS